MKQIIKLISFFIVLNSFSIATTETTENEEYEKLVARITQKIIKKWQYSPREQDDIYSILVYDVFMDRMDHDRKYFLISDINLFDQWREKLDDLIYEYDPEFFNLFDPNNATSEEISITLIRSCE